MASVYTYPKSDAAHVLEGEDAPVGNVGVEFFDGFMDGLQAFGIIEWDQLGTVGAHHHHLPVGHL